ncbi:MAG TPA: hypothetical protein VLN08_09795 [Vicinamibacterales bacterium]|nr:hypothetical protein [Vicinamibacterales bacterium]
MTKKTAAGPLPLFPLGDEPAPLSFSRGAREPYGIRWFGSTALLGHLRHLGAERLASGQMDTRDWMRPQPPADLLREVARVLEAPGSGDTLTERLGRDVWIDFVADTGDDSDVSSAVARMVAGEYALQDGSGRVLPRGDLLIFGGDTAYPLSSAPEIARRLMQPWNRVLRRKGLPDRARVMLGIPGNHDWYDGLDGFARMFRVNPLRERAELSDDADMREQLRQTESEDPQESSRAIGRVYQQLHLDELVGSLGLAEQAMSEALAVLTGRKVKKMSRLWLIGYRAVQEASYWLLPLAPNLDLWGVDRQLRTLDFRQRLFFNDRRTAAATARRMVISPDPAIAMGEPNRPGEEIVSACGLNLKQDPTCYVTGDSHHYERRAVGPSMHVIAGGGGAFVHGTRVHPYRRGRAPACAFPDAQTSRRLAASVPLQLVLGTAGLLPHAVCAGLAAVQLWAFRGGPWTGWSVTALVAAAASFFMFQAVVERRQRAKRSLAVALAHGPALALAPIGVAWLLARFAPAVAFGFVNVAVMALVGPFIIGYFLLTLIVTGLEHHQGYAVLGHPGFKHFVRFCVHQDGHVEAWTIGKVDTLGKGPPRLIDHFKW